MKKCFIALLAVIASLLGCDGPSGTEILGEIQLSSSSKDVIEIDSDGSTESVRFSSALDWHVECAETWLTIDPMEGGPGPARISFSVDANETQEVRQTVVNICSGTVKFPITVTQEPFIPTFELLDTEKVVSALGGEIKVRVHADVDYEVKIDADWIKDPVSRAPRTREHQFIIEPNPLPEERSAVITFCSGMICKAFSVTQRPAGTEADDWKKDAFVHRSLAMRFTATWCGYCPNMGSAFDLAKSQMSGSLELVSLHGGGSDYEFYGTDDLANRFRVAGFPTGVIDSRASITNFPSSSTTASVAMEVAQETQNAYPSKTGIALNSSLDGTSLTVDLSLYVKEADSYHVTVLLLEDGIVGYQNGGGNSYVHNDVARLALTSMSGESVRIAEDYQIWTSTYSATVNSKWNADNLKVLVYVEKPYGDQPEQAEVSKAKYGKYGDTYIDNCRVAKVGAESPLELR